MTGARTGVAARSRGRGGDRELLIRLGNVYKQLDAPFGDFGLDTLSADTAALAATRPGTPRTWRPISSSRPARAARSALVARIQAALAGVETGRHPLGFQEWSR